MTATTTPPNPLNRLPVSGDVLLIDRPASPQFITPFLFTVSRQWDWDAYSGWTWIEGYQLDNAGNAILKRSLFVIVEGLELIHETTQVHPRANAGKESPQTPQSRRPANRPRKQAAPHPASAPKLGETP